MALKIRNVAFQWYGYYDEISRNGENIKGSLSVLFLRLGFYQAGTNRLTSFGSLQISKYCSYRFKNDICETLIMSTLQWCINDIPLFIRNNIKLLESEKNFVLCHSKKTKRLMMRQSYLKACIF